LYGITLLKIASFTKLEKFSELWANLSNERFPEGESSTIQYSPPPVVEVVQYYLSMWGYYRTEFFAEEESIAPR
jgi:hypothetical protein